MTKDAADAVRADRGPLPAYIPGVGDRVRIVLEGKVVAAFNAESMFAVEGPDRRQNIIDPSAAHVISVEKLEAAEPEWLAGDVIRCDDHGGVLARNRHGDWISAFTGLAAPEGIEGCDVTLLVRGGETVAAAQVEK